MGSSIGHLPTPFPDEIIYSIFARYCQRARLSEPFTAMRSFFGTPFSIPVELPSHLDALISRLPQGHGYTADFLIDYHTTLPFYEFFVPEKQRHLVRTAMRGAGGAGVRSRLGIASGKNASPEFLQHCLECDKENRSTFGQTYWNRLHQLAGVYFCPKHQTLLERSSVLRGGKNRNVYFTAESACNQRQARFFDPTNSTHKNLLKISIDAEWLLKHATIRQNLAKVRRGYHFMLSLKGLATHKRTVKWNVLLPRFNQTYPHEILSLLGCVIESDRKLDKTWIARLLHTRDVAHPPIQHLLFINFLEISIEDFAGALVKDQLQPSSFFGRGPWNCFNTVCQQYKQKVIFSCSVENSQISKDRLVGRFKCENCGFIYSRFGPDYSTHKDLGDGWVTDYGELWHSQLKKVWMDHSLNIVESAKILGVAGKVVVKQATRWNLPSPKPSHNTRGGTHPKQWKGRKKVISAESLHQRRAIWIDLIEREVIGEIKLLSEEHRRLRYWLYKHDTAWLAKNPTTSKRKKTGRAATVNWNDRDATLVALVAPTAMRLKELQGCPKLISQLTICREIGKPAGLYNYRHKMPKFLSALQKAAETRSDLVVRKLFHAAEELKRKGYPATKSNLISRAGGYVWRWLSNPAVKAAMTSLSGK